MKECLFFTFFIFYAVKTVYSCSVDRRPSLESETNQMILYLSDIHFDIFYDSNAEVGPLQCKNSVGDPVQYDVNSKVNKNDFGKFLCNTNSELLNAILDKTKEINSSNPYDKIVIMGDTITHYLNLDTKNIKINYQKTYETIKSQLQLRFPNTPILFLLGNNDFVERYNIPDDINELERQIKSIEDNFLSLPDSVNKADIFNKITIMINKDETKINRLWYSYPLNTSVIGIFLDSVLWSSSANENGKEIPEELGLAQFKFLEDELNKAKSMNQKVIIHNHIPMHCNYYKGELKKNWKSKFLVKFEKLAYEYSNIIITIFSSHIHKGSLAIRESDDHKLFSVIYMPSISPSNGTNPGFSVLELKLNQLNNLKNYYLDLNLSNNEKKAIFKEFDYKKLIKSEIIDSNSIKSFLKDRDSNDDTFRNYLIYFNGLFGDSLEEIKKNYSYDNKSFSLIKCASYVTDSEEAKTLCKHLE